MKFNYWVKNSTKLQPPNKPSFLYSNLSILQTYVQAVYTRGVQHAAGGPQVARQRFRSGPRETSYIGCLIDPYALTRYCELQMRVLDFYFIGSLENTTKSIGIGGLKTFFVFLFFGLHLTLGKNTDPI